MKSYHLTQEQVSEIASKLELAGLDITAWENGYVEFETKEALQLFANAVLDQVLGEPVGYVNEHSLEMLKDSQQAKACATLWRTGIWDSANVALYAPKELPKESALGSLEQQPDGSVHFEEYKP